MATRNQFKILNNKCESYFNIAQKELGVDIKTDKDIDKYRIGFYFFMIESITNIKEIKEITNMIVDTEFNNRVFNKKIEDCGIDAVYIDTENRVVNLFNFKYREKYNEESRQHKNDAFISTKFINALINEKYDHLDGKVKEFAKEIIEKFNSKEEWKMNLYMVTNESKTMINDDKDIDQLKDLYDLDVKSIVLDDIVNFMSTRPDDINAKIILSRDAVLSYTESPLDSSKSYLLNIPVTELIRISCSDKNLRENSNLQDHKELDKAVLDYGVLFDNVRGYLNKSNYNNKIYKTLKDEPTKFFMYNNGITVTAEDIIAKEINGKKKIDMKIQNFQIVNGGQTLRTIYDFKDENSDNLDNYLENAEVLVKIFKTGKEDKLKRKISEYTNSQNAISAIDLKSIATEQIEIEQILDSKNIIYARKIGDTGNEEKSYDHKISMEKFAQILFSMHGNPDKASNQKNNLFDKHYDSIFKSDKFDIGESPNIVKKYYEIKNVYSQHPEIDESDQKIFYIIYLQEVRNESIIQDIQDLESCLDKYKPKTTISRARMLITAGFKKYLDENLLSSTRKK